MTEASSCASALRLPSPLPSPIPLTIADLTVDDDAMDVDEEWTYSPASSDDETQTDAMDIDVDWWSYEVEDVEMIDMTAESDNLQLLAASEAPCFTCVNNFRSKL